MFTIDYFESADPVFMFLQEQRERLLSRPYAGYFIFLFGKSDEEIATWFARNVVALDSLTGSNLAGLVFAQKVRLQAQKITRKGQPQDINKERIDANHLNISQIGQVQEFRKPYFRNDVYDLGFLPRRMVPSQDIVKIEHKKEITAITYASDEIAQLFNVVGDLPCIVLLDAIPTGTVEVIKLSETGTDEILKLLRQLIAEFGSEEKYKPFFELIRSIDHLSREVKDVEQEISRLNERLASVGRHDFRELWEMHAADALFRGNTKRVHHILSNESGLQNEELRTVLGKLGKFEALSSKLRGQTGHLVQMKADDMFPNAEKQRKQELPLLRSQLRSQIELEIQSATDRKNSIEATLEETSLGVKELEVPSLQRAFRTISTQNKIRVASRNFQTAVYDWLGSFLKPETLAKLSGILK